PVLFLLTGHTSSMRSTEVEEQGRSHAKRAETFSEKCQRLQGSFKDWVVAPYVIEDEGEDGRCSEEDVSQLMQPQEKPLVHRLVNSNGFEACSMMSIILCMFFLGADAACFKDCSDATKVFYDVMNQFFVFMFLLEWILRVLKDGKRYFIPVKAEHVLDTGIVWICGILLGWIIPLAAADGQKSPIAQSLNVLRSMRTLRFFAFLKNFETFKMLLAGFLRTQATLAACVILLAMVDLMFGIIALELIGRFEPWGLAERGSAAWSFQNGLIQSCMGMTRFIFFDNALDMMQELMERQPYIWIFCFLHMAISAYVILNLVTAVICEKAQSMTQDNLAERAKELQEEERRTLQELRSLFLKLDADGSGQVTMEEFDAAFKVPEIRNKFLLLGFDEDEAKHLFKVLDADGEGALSVSEFTKGMAEVKGEATAKGMLIAKKKAEQLEKLVLKILPQDDSVEGEKDRLAVEEAEPERVGELLETQMRDFEKAAHMRIDEIERQCKVAKSAATDLEELVSRLRRRKDCDHCLRQVLQ
ncbi:Sodium channel protein type 3 subunit alpha, partial [Durusdinium trenchii]